jgi:cytochrome P450
MASGLAYLGIGLLTVLLLKRLWAYLVDLPLPPGPPPLPLIGNVHQAPKSHAWLQYHEWSKKYGPVMYLNMAGQSVVILSTTQAATDLLNRRSAQYSDRPSLVVAGELVTKGLHMLLRPYNARYRLHQRMGAPLLNFRASNAYRPVQDLESKQLLFDLLAGYDREGEKGIDPEHWLERMTASIIYALLYGYRLKTGDELELTTAKHVQAEAVKNLEPGAHLVDSFPILKYLPEPLAPWKKPAEMLYQLERNLHLGNLERGLASPGWTFSKHMKASPEAQDMSAEELAFDLGILANAALDTSTITMFWFVVACITEDSDFVAKAQKLIDEVVGRNRLPSFDDRPRLVYIDAIMNEVLRWRPTVTGGAPHATRTKDTYQGYRIPADSVVLANHWAIVREESVFGQNADSFLPERWIAGGGDDAKASEDSIKDLPSTGFGFGRRVCTGQHIARNSLFLTFARLLWAFDIEAGMSEETGQQATIDPMASTPSFTAKPLPFKAVFRPRGPLVRELIEKDCDTHGFDLAEILDQVAADRTIKV